MTRPPWPRACACASDPHRPLTVPKRRAGILVTFRFLGRGAERIGDGNTDGNVWSVVTDDEGTVLATDGDLTKLGMVFASPRYDGSRHVDILRHAFDSRFYSITEKEGDNLPGSKPLPNWQHKNRARGDEVQKDSPRQPLTIEGPGGQEGTTRSQRDRSHILTTGSSAKPLPDPDLNATTTGTTSRTTAPKTGRKEILDTERIRSARLRHGVSGRRVRSRGHAALVPERVINVDLGVATRLQAHSTNSSSPGAQSIVSD